MNLKSKNILVTGIASNRSISFSIAKILHEAGANVIVSYQNERLKDRVIKLADDIGITNNAYQCDLTNDDEILNMRNDIIEKFNNLDGIVHSAAFAPREQLNGKYLDNITKDGFLIAHDVSVFTFTALAKAFRDDLNEKASLITLSYIGANKVVQNYNVMGIAKASLESSVKYLADSLGEKNIRVNAISAGPIKTLAASGISGFNKILDIYESKSPIKANITSEDVAKTAFFLLSDYSTAITGQTIYVDNGFNIILFPEGTTSDGNGVIEFKSSMLECAFGNEREISIQPITLCYTKLNNIPMGIYQRRNIAWVGDTSMVAAMANFLRSGRITVDIIFHEIMNINNFENRKDLAQYCEKQIITGLNQMIKVN